MILQRNRSTHYNPGIGHFPHRAAAEGLCWECTSMLVEEARTSHDNDLTEINGGEAGQSPPG